MADHCLPRLPAEIIDRILETVICAHPSTLASLACVAHSFRHTVNGARFRRLELFLNFITARTKLLVDILSCESAVWPTGERTARYVRELHLIFASFDTWHDAALDRPIATIIGAISLAHQGPTYLPPTHGLHIRISSPDELTAYGGRRWSISSFATVNLDIKAALHELYSSSALVESLELYNISDVPCALDLVLSSRAAVLVIDGAHFCMIPSGIRWQPRVNPPFKNIRRLRVRNSPSFLDILRELQDDLLPALDVLGSCSNGTSTRLTLRPGLAL